MKMYVFIHIMFVECFSCQGLKANEFVIYYTYRGITYMYAMCRDEIFSCRVEGRIGSLGLIH